MPDPIRQSSGFPRRGLPVLLLVAVAVVVAVILLGSRDGRTYDVELLNAGQLVVGQDLVRIGGVPAGAIEDIELGANDMAVVKIRLHSGRPALHDGTSAVVRARGLAGAASRYIDISPGPNTSKRLDDGATLTASRTQSIVDLDQLFNTLDPETRQGLQRLIDGSADWYDGVETRANRSARYFPAALTQLRDLAAEIDRDTPAFAQFLVQVGGATETLAARREQLTSLVGDARQTADALSSDTAALGDGLRRLTPAVQRGAETLDGLREAVPDLRRLVEASDAPSRTLPGFFRDARPALQRAVPVFTDLRRTLDTPGESNDLVDALRALPRLAGLTERTFPRAQRALRDGLPIISFIRPYTPDLVSWLHSFGSVMGTYDATGHYARTQPVFGAYDVRDDGQGGTLVQQPPSLRSNPGALSTGNLKRCPGGAGPTADGSGGFVDSGPDANADCDPSQSVRGDG